MKKFLLTLLLLSSFIAKAQVPFGYYNAANGLNGVALKQTLHNIIKGHNDIGYNAIWNAFQSTDTIYTTKIWDIYTYRPNQTSPILFDISKQCGNYNSPGDCYNREHSWPQSFFNKDAPMVSDLFHIYPTDGYTNGKRDNNPYGIVTNPTWSSVNQSKLGNNTTPGAPAGNAFEPIDEFKGDLARTYFYMSTRYYTEDGSWQDWEMAYRAELRPWAVTMLLDWHRQDAVSEKEIKRNNAIYALQQNRNPFIDSPSYAECIWSNSICVTSGMSFVKSEIKVQVFPNPASNYIQVYSLHNHEQILDCRIINLQGQVQHVPVLTAKNDQWSFEVAHLPTGLYGVQIKSLHGSYYQMFLKQ